MMSNNKSNIDIDLLIRFFSEECTPDEQEAVLGWKEASPGNKAEFNTLLEVWNTLEKTSPERNIDIEEEWNRHQELYISNGREKNKLLSFTIKIAASVLVILGMAYWGWHYLSNKTISSEIASIQNVSLPDGSSVTLNASSKLKYKTSFGKETRNVTLEGEAYFEVAKNPDKPFIIHVNNIEIKVLGTSFNVKAYKDQNNIEVTVAEGTVSVYHKNTEDKPVIITKGQQAIYSTESQIIEKKENSNQNFIAWKTRTIIFENDNLSDIVKTLQSVYHQEFVIENAQLKNCRLTSSFENKDLKSVLKILESTLEISFEEKDGKIIIKGKGC